MVNQTDSKDGVPRKDSDRPTPDVGSHTDGQSDQRGTGATDQQGGNPQGQDYRGEGPAKVGLTSSAQPGLVAPSGVNQRDHGVADDKPMAGDTVNLDDDDEINPRGRTTAAGGTWEAQGGDSGRLGAPSAGLSDRNGPSDPERLRDAPSGD
jgi:hypothetical protein